MQNKKQTIEYIALVLTGCHGKIYTGTDAVLKCNIVIATGYVPPFTTQISLSGPGSRSEIVDKFLEHVDNMLDLFLNGRPLPVFVFGTAPAIERFKKITRHHTLITGLFAGNYQDVAKNGILAALQPYFKNWKTGRSTITIDSLYHDDIVEN